MYENETSKAVVEAIQDMFFDMDTDEYDEDYIAEYAERIDEIIVNYIFTGLIKTLQTEAPI